MFEEDLDIKAIREGIKALCLKFPNEYWRNKDRTRTYPVEFVKMLSEHGYLGCLIPEEYGGSPVDDVSEATVSYTHLTLPTILLV